MSISRAYGKLDCQFERNELSARLSSFEGLFLSTDGTQTNISKKPVKNEELYEQASSNDRGQKAKLCTFSTDVLGSQREQEELKERLSVFSHL